MSLLTVDNLTLQFDTDEGRITAVDDVSFDLEAGRSAWALSANRDPENR